jgi:diphosphomevalonate decarboxylase
MSNSATAVAHPNIAFVKYWGNRDERLRIPANGSISMTLEGLETRTKVEFLPDLEGDQLTINSRPVRGESLNRVSRLLDRVRKWSGMTDRARVTSKNNFPMGSGIASSASAFAALSLAASSAAGLSFTEKELSRLARTGSGSACRSIPGGFVEWQAGAEHENSYAVSFAGPKHWDLVDLVTVISHGHKRTGSTEGHRLADTSPLQAARVADAPRRLNLCRTAILKKDFETFAGIVEQDSNLMHAVMMTSQPPLFYWQPGTVKIMREVKKWRQEGVPVCFTIDAGPNVHVLCLEKDAKLLEKRLKGMPEVEDIFPTFPGGGAYLLQRSLNLGSERDGV